MFQSLKLIAFDLDDTIVAFDLLTNQSWQEVCNDYVADHQELDTGVLIANIKKAGALYWSNPEKYGFGKYDIVNARRTFLKMAFEQLQIDRLDEAVQLADNYSRIRIENMYLFDGITDLLQQLSFKYILVLITNRDSAGQRSKIKRFDLEKYFAGIYIEEEMGYGKPDTRVYKKVMTDNNVLPQECLMIGDTPEMDIIAPGKMGWKTIFVNTRKIDPQFTYYKPDLILENTVQVINNLPIK